MRTEPEVGRIHAFGVISSGAVVANDHSIGDWASIDKPCRLVGTNMIPFLVFPFSNRAISILAEATRPQPAPVGARSFIDFGFPSLLKRHREPRWKAWILGAVRHVHEVIRGVYSRGFQQWRHRVVPSELEMFGVYARSVSTKREYSSPIGNFPVVHKPRHKPCANISFTARALASANHAISFVVHRSGPKPAITRLLDLGPKSLTNRIRQSAFFKQRIGMHYCGVKCAIASAWDWIRIRLHNLAMPRPGLVPANAGAICYCDGTSMVSGSVKSR